MTPGHGRRAGTSPCLHRVVGLTLGAASAGAWLTFVAANGFARGNDTRGYLRPADALWSLRVVTSARTPGYPIFLVACRALAAALGTELGWVVAVLQTILLAGVTTVLVHDLGWRLTTRPGIGAWRRFSSRSTLTCNSTAPPCCPRR